VLGGDEGVLAGCRPGTVIAVHSTILPATCRELAAIAGDRGVTILDAPVSGGRAAVLDGSLVVAVGGDDEAVERCRPFLESFGNPVVHVGPVGSAQLVKLVNNTLLAANMTLADDALTIGQMLGVTPEAMHQVLRLGSGRSFALDVLFGARASAEVRQRAREPLEKDVHALATDAAVSEVEGVAAILDAAGEAIRRLAQPPPR
jgi:3-hydroxyisobutyrate dehydrogenase-like beta-hydroxyacid dehydrogenase